MESIYSFAGITFRVTGRDGEMYRDDGVLTPFFVEMKQADVTLEFRLKDCLSEPEGECIYRDGTMQVFEANGVRTRYQGAVEKQLQGAYLRIRREGNHSQVQASHRMFPYGITAKSVLNAMEAEHWIAQRRGFLLHASFIIHEGEAILFTAPSGTGKSTQADLWCRLRGAEQINGDRAAVTVSQNGIHAWGIPFSGSSGICKNASAPLKAIVFLSQSPQTEICRLRGVKAFRRVWEGCSINVWDKQDVDLCSYTVMDALAMVPVFHLACTPDESAVIALEQAMEQI